MSEEIVGSEERIESTITGIVKWFNTRKGYGFIIPDESHDIGKDIFVHYSAIQVEQDEFATLNQNDEVEFEVIDTDRGFEARNVVVTKKAPKSRQLWDAFY
jgi:CspA family cold shock protein